MQNFNLHTHTARCGHGEGLDIQYIHSAITAGFQLLGFSEHIPYVEMRLPACRMFYEQKDEYITTIRKLAKQFQNQIEIKVGYEIEYMEDHLEHILQMKQQCDYLILGQHCKYIGYEYDCYCSDEDTIRYTEQIEAALDHDIISYVAHPDYFMLGRRSWNKTCIEAAHRIAKVCAMHQVPLEINLAGFRYGKKSYEMMDAGGHFEERYPYPFKEFWEIVSSYDCDVVYGYDAHSPIVFQEKERISMAEDILQGIPLHFVDHVRLR